MAIASSIQMLLTGQRCNLAQWLLLGVAMLLSTSAATAAELVMIEQDGCHYCMIFNREIDPHYAGSVAGKRAPLRRVNLKHAWPTDLSNIAADYLTPTFVLVENNVEYGRLRGYPGKKQFWYLLNEMLDKLPK